MSRSVHNSESQSAPRPQRLELRVGSQQKELFQRAADLQGLTLTEFVTVTLVAAAKDAIKEAGLMTLTTQDQEAFFDALANPPAPSRNMLKAAGRYKRLGL
jgi:uncharacterized protein (DUF1778 family)